MRWVRRYHSVAESTAVRDAAGGDSHIMMRLPLMARLDHRDRALFLRWVIGGATPRRAMRAWTLLTHLGGLRVSVGAVLLPLALGGPAARGAASVAAVALLLSHLVVQLIKRRVLRERPSVRVTATTHVLVPDKFSFPSGHACAVMSVAFSYAAAFPSLALPLLLLSSLVGFSRVRLGVHYPGDVVAGQLIAIATGAALLALR
jgi:undecaprenyl-diphosphatase